MRETPGPLPKGRVKDLAPLVGLAKLHKLNLVVGEGLEAAGASGSPWRATRCPGPPAGGGREANNPVRTQGLPGGEETLPEGPMLIPLKQRGRHPH
jgi:hypothetical protein